MVRSKLWTRNFGLLCVINLLLTGSLYMLLPVLPHWAVKAGFTQMEGWILSAVTGLTFGCMGPFCSFLLDRYNRRKVCLYSLLTVALCMFSLTGVNTLSFAGVLLVRMIQGGAYGMAQMALGSGLVIDLTVSERRTDGNFCYNSLGRLALPLGPFAGWAAGLLLGWENAIGMACGGVMLAVLLLLLLNVPFRAPLGVSLISADRFWLKSGWPLFFVLGLSNVALGYQLLQFDMHAYVFLLLGAFMAFLFSRICGRRITARGEILLGVLLLALGCGTGYLYPSLPLCPVLVGMGSILATIRGMLSLLRMAAHCERGCANSTYMLAVESGLSIGMLLFILKIL